MPTALAPKTESAPAVTRAVLRTRARGAMLGLALGDALGATVEFMTPREIRANLGVHRQVCGGGWLHLRPGQVTDDTTMSFALAEAWLASAQAPDARACAEAFDGWMRSRPVDIGHTVRRGIVYFRRTGEPEVQPSEDAGNGAAMRCLPVALAALGAAPETVAALNARQAHVTHNNPLSDAACVCLLAMVQAALLGAGADQVMAPSEALVTSFPVFGFAGQRVENPTGYIVDSMRAVLQGLRDNATDFETCLVDVANRGGDADTTAAMAGMVAGARVGEAGLPAAWLKVLEREVRVRCADYADALIARSPLWQALPDD